MNHTELLPIAICKPIYVKYLSIISEYKYTDPSL